MWQVIVIGIFALVLGLAATFFGYRLFRVFLPVIGFFLGFWITAEVMAQLIGENFIASTFVLVASIIIGVLIAFASYAVYTIAVGILMVGFAVALWAHVFPLLGIESDFLIGVIALVVVAVAIWATIRYRLQRYFVSALMAIFGANLVLYGILLFLGRVSLAETARVVNTIRPVLQDSLLWLVAWLALAIIGTVVQIRMDRNWDFPEDALWEDWGK